MNGLNTSFSHHFFGKEGIGAVLVLGFALGMVLLGLAEMRRGAQLVAEAVHVVGEVTDKYRASGSSGSSGPRRRVHYRFTPEGASEPIESYQKVGWQMYVMAREGQARRVYYLPDNPEVNEIDPGVTLINGRNSLLWGIGAGLVALALAVLAYRKGAASRARYRDGSVRRARIVAHEPAGETKEGKPLFRPVWRDDFGGEGRLAPGIEGLVPVIGLEVKMLIDPAGRFPPERIWP